MVRDIIRSKFEGVVVALTQPDEHRFHGTIEPEYGHLLDDRLDVEDVLRCLESANTMSRPDGEPLYSVGRVEVFVDGVPIVDQFTVPSIIQGDQEARDDLFELVQLVHERYCQTMGKKDIQHGNYSFVCIRGENGGLV